jgi:hypothetical protein
MRRWFVLLLIGHVAGSYLAELHDVGMNYPARVSAWEGVTAPVRLLPLLVRHTVKSPDAAWVPYWIAYTLPVAIAIVVALLRGRRPRPPARGFDPLPPHPPS